MNGSSARGGTSKALMRTGVTAKARARRGSSRGSTANRRPLPGGHGDAAVDRRSARSERVAPRSARFGRNSSTWQASRERRADMHAVVRTYSGQGASELFDELGRREED